MAQELYDITMYQRTPSPVTDLQYHKMVVRGIRRMWLDTGRALTYSEDLLTYDSVNTDMPVQFEPDLKLDEYEAALLAAQIEFFRTVQADVNNIVGYSTDALTVTNSDKPYANLSDTIRNLESRYQSAIYKHVRYMML